MVLATNGRTTRVDGGYRVSGEWSYNSASWHTSWAILGAELVDQDGNLNLVNLVTEDRIAKAAKGVFSDFNQSHQQYKISR